MRDIVRDLLSARQKVTIVDPDRKPSAVLLLLCPGEDDFRILFTRRTTLVEDHKGEVSFPGGAFHEGVDASLLETALRESHEEVGVPPENVEVLGALDDTITRSNYIISPYVGLLLRPQEFRPAAAEVAEVLEAPLRWLLHPANVRNADVTPRLYAGRPVNGLYYEFGDSVIYGATCRILRQFLGLLPVGFPE